MGYKSFSPGGSFVKEASSVLLSLHHPLSSGVQNWTLVLLFTAPFAQHFHCTAHLLAEPSECSPTFLRKVKRGPRARTIFLCVKSHVLPQTSCIFCTLSHSLFKFYIDFSPLQIVLAFWVRVLVFPLASNLPSSLRLRVQALHGGFIDGISTQHRAQYLGTQQVFIQRCYGERKIMSFGTKQT